MARKSENYLNRVIDEIYRAMYKETTPPANLDEIAKSGEGKNENWFLNYFLPIARQEEIISEICKKHKLTNIETQRIAASVHLGHSPRGYKDE